MSFDTTPKEVYLSGDIYIHQEAIDKFQAQQAEFEGHRVFEGKEAIEQLNLNEAKRDVKIFCLFGKLKKELAKGNRVNFSAYHMCLDELEADPKHYRILRHYMEPSYNLESLDEFID